MTIEGKCFGLVQDIEAATITQLKIFSNCFFFFFSNTYVTVMKFNFYIRHNKNLLHNSMGRIFVLTVDANRQVIYVSWICWMKRGFTFRVGWTGLCEISTPTQNGEQLKISELFISVGYLLAMVIVVI